MEDFESDVLDIDTEWDSLMADLFGENYSTDSNGWDC